MRQRGGFGAVLVWAALGPAAHGEPFLHAGLEVEPAPLPARYRGPLPAWLEPDPSAASWRRRLDSIPNGPTHLQWRLCHEGAPERERFVEALRRAAPAGALAEDDAMGFQLAFPQCWDARDRASVCAWVPETVGHEAPGPARDFFYGQLVACSERGDRALFERADAPDWAVIAFHRERGPLGYSERLAEAVRRSAEADDRRLLGRHAAVLGRVDDARVAALLLELYAAGGDATSRRALGFALRHQSEPAALEVYRREWQAWCRTRQRAHPNPRARPLLIFHRLGYLDTPVPCRAGQTARVEPPRPPPPTAVATRFRQPPHDAQRRAALAAFGLEEGWLRFAADDAEAIGTHGPLLRRLADRVRPDLDGLVLEEVWPALDGFAFERGPVPGFALVGGGHGFRVGLEGAGDTPAPGAELALTEELRAALAEPHFVDAYLDGVRLRIPLRPLGPFYDVEAMVGALNQLLERRRSERRLVVLEPHDSVEVLAGPRGRLRDAIEAGAAPLADPFAAARRSPEFDPALLGMR